MARARSRRRVDRAPARATIPARLLTRVRRSCLALPGAREEVARVGVRWVVRGRTFAHVVPICDGRPAAYARAAGDDGPLVVLTVRAAGFLYDALRQAGPPYFVAPWGTRWGAPVIGICLGPRPPWPEIEILVAESHRLMSRPRAPRATTTRGARAGVKARPRRG